MRGDLVVRVKRHNSRSVVIRWSPARWWRHCCSRWPHKCWSRVCRRL